MAAAYAALASLKYLIHNLQTHPSPPISINQQQLRLLTQLATSLLEFLRGYNSSSAYSDEADPLEIRIADAAYAAEDVIEPEIVDRIRSGSTTPGKATGDDLYQDLQLVIEEMELIEKETMTIRTDNSEPQLRRNVGSSSSTSFSAGKKNTMVGFDDVFPQLLETLTGDKPDLQIIPITGMAGIGKTTLARNIFENDCIKEHFIVCAWTTISQEYNAHKALKELLSQVKGYSSGKSEDELGLELYQWLSGRRYLIIIDDMWSIEVWYKIRHFFPSCKNRSRIMVTTRQSRLASHFNNYFKMNFQDEVRSWDLFSRSVFGEESFPLELEDIGKEIVRKCRGLPLSIVTIGGFLAKSKQTREHWEDVKENLNSIVSLEDDEYCLEILKMSYNYLPVHLKPCFLYAGLYKEDHEIFAFILLIKWVSEGFVEPTSEKSLETIAYEYLEELVDRNLIIAHKLGSLGEIQDCKIHDLLRNMCQREAAKERLYGIVSQHIPQGINNFRRMIIYDNTSDEMFLEALESLSHARSLLCHHETADLMPPNLRLLHVDHAADNVFDLVNLRELYIGAMDESQFTSSFNLLWNLQALFVCEMRGATASIQIWNMPCLRHFVVGENVRLLDPPIDNDFIMENLVTLEVILNFKLNRDIIKRIPNIRELSIEYDGIESNGDYYCLNNLECLHKLELLDIDLRRLQFRGCQKMLSFPQSLKTLNLQLNDDFELEEMLEKIGSLTLLKRLHLTGGMFRTGNWETVEGQFPKLASLVLIKCHGLEQWASESSDFPLLEELFLCDLGELTEIPPEIGDLPKLRLIILERCKESVFISARNILDEQVEVQGQESFHVRVYVKYEEEREALLQLEGPNFHVMARHQSRYKQYILQLVSFSRQCLNEFGGYESV